MGRAQQGHRVGVLQLHGSGLLQMPQRPAQAGAAQIEALEAAGRGVALLVLRVHRPVALGPAAALDVVDDVLQGGLGPSGVPGGVAQGFVAGGVEQHGAGSWNGGARC